MIIIIMIIRTFKINTYSNRRQDGPPPGKEGPPPDAVFGSSRMWCLRMWCLINDNSYYNV